MLIYVKYLHLSLAQIEFLFLHRHPTQIEFGHTAVRSRSGQGRKKLMNRSETTIAQVSELMKSTKKNNTSPEITNMGIMIKLRPYL